MVLQSGKKVVTAFLLAPLIPACVLMLISLVGSPLEGLWALLLVAPASYAVALIPGLPLYFLFRRLSWISAFGCVLIGLLCSVVASIFFMRTSIEQALASSSRANWSPFLSFSAVAGILGCAAGYAFWRISISRFSQSDMSKLFGERKL